MIGNIFEQIVEVGELLCIVFVFVMVCDIFVVIVDVFLLVLYVFCIVMNQLCVGMRMGESWCVDIGDQNIDSNNVFNYESVFK